MERLHSQVKNAASCRTLAAQKKKGTMPMKDHSPAA